MDNLTPVEYMNLVACLVMMFFLGLQIEVSKRTQNIARILWVISLIIVWICIFLRG